MKTLSIFPTVLHKFENPDPRTDEVISLIEEYDPAQRTGTWAQWEEIRVETTDGILHKEPRFQFLMNWFRECLKEYHEYYELDCDGLDIAVCWGNKSSPGRMASHHIHNHNLSYVSAVYYVTKGSPTVFLDPFASKGGIALDVNFKKNREIEREIYPEPGTLIMFPSWLPHCSRPHKGKESRYTMSFNALPVGKVHANLYGFPMAHITLDHYATES
jgi:uncharacterized protein (TIGR02466 family)